LLEILENYFVEAATKRFWSLLLYLAAVLRWMIPLRTALSISDTVAGKRPLASPDCRAARNFLNAVRRREVLARLREVRVSV